MKSKMFKDHELFFTKYVPYEGPMILMACPPNTILHLCNKYVVDIDHKYYELLEVRYLDTTYDFKDFVEKYPSVIGF